MILGSIYEKIKKVLGMSMKKILLTVMSVVAFGATGCLGSGLQRGEGAGVLLNPGGGGGSFPSSGMSGTDGSVVGGGKEETGDGATGAGAGGGAGPEAPSTFSDTPITIIGAPIGQSTTETPCTIVGATLCFGSLDIEATGPGDGPNRLTYKATGGFYEKSTATSALTPLTFTNLFILLEDLVFPDQQGRALAAQPDPLGIFTATFIAAPGHDLALMATMCNRTAYYEFKTPENGKPLLDDPCSSSGPTDLASPTPIHPRASDVKAAGIQMNKLQ
jgi:hypothetical protein